MSFRSHLSSHHRSDDRQKLYRIDRMDLGIRDGGSRGRHPGTHDMSRLQRDQTSARCSVLASVASPTVGTGSRRLRRPMLVGTHMVLGFAFTLAGLGSQTSSPETQAATGPQTQTPQTPATTVTCTSKPGERTQCPADTSAGVVLLRSTGEAPCLLGRTWGYDQTSVWVSDGCSARVRHRRAPSNRRRRSPSPSSTFRTSASCSSTASKGQIYFRLFSYARYLNQRNLDESYVDAFGNTQDRAAAPGHPAAEVLRAVLRLVPHAEDALLPLRLVVERVAGRSGAGRRRGQPDLTLQPVRERGRRHHVAAVRAEHGGPVPVLARRGRPPDCRRVLPRLVHLRRLAQGRVPHQAQVHGDVRQQPEHARRERGAARQQARHAVLLAPVAADDGRVRPVEHVRRLRRSPEGRDAGRRALHAQPRGKTEPAGHRRHREQPDPADGRQRHLHAGPVRAWHHRQRSGLPDDEHRCGRQVQGPVARRPSTTGAG